MNLLDFLLGRDWPEALDVDPELIATVAAAISSAAAVPLHPTVAERAAKAAIAAYAEWLDNPPERY